MGSGLPPGNPLYTLLTHNTVRARDVKICGANVTTLDWRTA